MNKIRKIWIGQSIKTDSMSWEVGQNVGLGNKERGIVDEIIQTDEGYEVLVKKGNEIIPWKFTTMNVTVEFDLVY